MLNFQENIEPESRHSEDLADIITKVPSWLLRWGTTLFIIVLFLIISFSFIIDYPDIIKAQIKISSPNAPKPIISKVSGKIVKLLVKENEEVHFGQSLAFIESTANHYEVLNLLLYLKQLQKSILINDTLGNIIPKNLRVSHLGELQVDYGVFLQACLTYKSTLERGIYSKRRILLKGDLFDIDRKKIELDKRRKIQQRDLDLAQEDYDMHKKLGAKNVETISEFRQEESKFLSKKIPLIETEQEIIDASVSYSIKKKEILDLDNQTNDEKEKFIQSVNSLISFLDEWKNRYVLVASQSGKVSFSGTIQQNLSLLDNQEVFFINPHNSNDFFGELIVRQSSMGKIKKGQKVIIKLQSYPFEQYGVLRGKIQSISDVPYRDSLFISKVTLVRNSKLNINRRIELKQGMLGTAEIITTDATLFQRLMWSIFKIINQENVSI